MAEHRLSRCRILIVEDEYLLADELRSEFGDRGANVIGPAGTVEDAIDLIMAAPRIDGAVLDVNLRGEMAFPVAELLMERGVPFIFTTGYDASALPPRFLHVVRCEKPVNIGRITEAISRTLHPEPEIC